jgi:nicotinamide-nucleotide amidase
MAADLVQRLSDALRKSGRMLAAAESCTGGMIAAAITALPGSSAIFDRGFVTYSNEAKMDMLDVDPLTLERHGAVSEETAIEMAEGALDNSNAGIAVSVTGIAGPSGGTEEKPVGLVYMAVATPEVTKAFRHHFAGDRAKIREKTVNAALQHILDFL